MADLVPLLVQVPLVGVFMWFVLEMQKRADVDAAKRGADWRGFLDEQRRQMYEALGRLAEEIKANSAQMAAMTALLTAHDARSQEFMRRSGVG